MLRCAKVELSVFAMVALGSQAWSGTAREPDPVSSDRGEGSMNANTRAGKLGKCLAIWLLAAMPMGAAHAVGLMVLPEDKIRVAIGQPAADTARALTRIGGRDRGIEPSDPGVCAGDPEHEAEHEAGQDPGGW